MLSVALKRLGHRPLLTLLSIVGVTLSVGLMAAIPLFAHAISFSVLDQELDALSARSGRPRFPVMIYAVPSKDYPLTVREADRLTDKIADTFVDEVGLPLVSVRHQLESDVLALDTGDQVTPYGEPYTVIEEYMHLVVLPGVESHIEVVDGRTMEQGRPSGDVLDVWMYEDVADKMGIEVGEMFELSDRRDNTALSIRIAGLWRPTDPEDRAFWFSDPNATLRRGLLVNEDAYEALVEPVFGHKPGIVSWYLILDDRALAPERMRASAAGLSRGMEILASMVAHPRMDASSPMDELQSAIVRQDALTVRLFVFSVPIVGFLLYFVALISAIAAHWQRHETAISISRGMEGWQLLVVGLVESAVIASVGSLLGMLLGLPLAQVMGYAQSFMSFTWRAPLPISPTAYNAPMILAAVGASVLARLWPLVRAAHTGVVSYERERSRASSKPLWQRRYLDVLLWLVVIYVYRRLAVAGTLVPVGWTEDNRASQDPLLFLAPTLFILAASLLLVRLFPLVMRIGDWLCTLGRQPVPYLAFRQLARQSGRYANTLLLVITALSVGALTASLALSLDQWTADRVYYAIGSDLLIEQMPRPPDPLNPFEIPIPPDEGAWSLPVDSYLTVPGVVDATRVGFYPCEMRLDRRLRNLRQGTFIGIDRLDVPRVAFFRPDFGPGSMVALMNRLAENDRGVLLSENMLAALGQVVGDEMFIQVDVVDFSMATDFEIVGTYRYFPTVFEARTNHATIVGNLGYLFKQVGATLMHDIWLQVEAGADRAQIVEDIRARNVYISHLRDARAEIAHERAQPEHVGVFGLLTVGFLAAALLAGVAFLVYNYASLQERLFRFAILRAVGLSISQIVGEVTIEYVALLLYGVLGGAATGIWAAHLFIPFFQATDMEVVQPPRLIPLIAWRETGWIAGAFAVVLIVAQLAVIAASVRRGTFQALRLGDQE